MKRITPETDFDRLAERINRDYGRFIQDKETFDTSFNDYLEDVDTDSRIFLSSNMNHVFSIYATRFRVDKGSTFKKAKGKSFKRDIRQTAKTVVTTKQEYIKRGAKNVDLKGYDTKRARIKAPSASAYRFRGRKKGKIVFARALNTKLGLRYIDRRGQYVSIKKR